MGLRVSIATLGQAEGCGGSPEAQLPAAPVPAAAGHSPFTLSACLNVVSFFLFPPSFPRSFSVLWVPLRFSLSPPPFISLSPSLPRFCLPLSSSSPSPPISLSLAPPPLASLSKAAALDHHWVAKAWLNDIGLPQYSQAFQSHLVDGRMLNSLMKRDLEKHLNVSKKFHQVSILLGIELLYQVNFSREVRTGGQGGHSPAPAVCPSDPLSMHLRVHPPIHPPTHLFYYLYSIPQ